MKLILILIVLAIQIQTSIFGQLKINNEVTQKHQRVSGTNLYLVPPDGFAWQNESRRFVNSNLNSAISISDIPSPLEVVHSQMSEQELAGQGSTLIGEQTIVLNGLKGYFIKTSRIDLAGKKVMVYTLLMGDHFERTLITHVIQCIFPDQDQVVGHSMEQAIFSTVYKPVISHSKKPFSLNYDKYEFALWKNMNGVDYYKSKGKSELELIIQEDYFFVKIDTDPNLIFYNRMQRLPYSSIEVDDNGVESMQLAGLAGLQATISAIDEHGQQKYLYQVLLNQDQNYFLFQGVSPSADGLKKIKNVIRTFSLDP